MADEPPSTAEAGIPGAFSGETITRRRAMTRAAQAAGAVAAAAVGLPALGFALGPVFKRAPTTWQPLARTDKGVPDGSCTDSEGYLWNAEWGGRRVVRYAPTGEIERVIELPVSRPSCPTFGGPDLRTLFVTSARYLMSSPEEDRQDVWAGSLYAIELDDVQGVPANLFAL